MSLGIIAMLLSRTTAFGCSLRPVQYKVDCHKQAGDFQPHDTDELLSLSSRIQEFCDFFVVVKLKYNDIFSVPLSPLKVTMYLYPYPQIHFLWLHFFQVGYFLSSVCSSVDLFHLDCITWYTVASNIKIICFLEVCEVSCDDLYTNDTMSV